MILHWIHSKKLPKVQWKLLQKLLHSLVLYEDNLCVSLLLIKSSKLSLLSFCLLDVINLS